MQYAYAIEELAYQAMSLHGSRDLTGNYISSPARLDNSSFYAYGVSPSDLFDRNLHMDYIDKRSDLPLTE